MNALHLALEALEATPPRTQQAIAALRDAIEQKPEPTGYQVWWGVSVMRPLDRAFPTRAEAEACAAKFRSNTEVRPLYASPQPAAPQPVAVPQGYAVVPVEPTPEMLEACREVKRQRLQRAVSELKRGARPDPIAMTLAVDEEWVAMLAAAPQPVAVPVGFEWPKPPPRKGQSDVLFDDGYDEGWAMCIESMKSLLAAAPQAPSREPWLDQDGEPRVTPRPAPHKRPPGYSAAKGGITTEGGAA